MSNQELSMLFFLQLAVILLAVRLVGQLARRFGQPQVVGEMIAGVLLGPSLLGALFPEFQARLFPEESESIIYAVSQLGLVLYMFLIGAEFNVELVRGRMRSAAAVSFAGIITPFLLGCLLAAGFQDSHDLFAPEVHLWEAMLFTGAAMSITAFPMLARIIFERGLAGTSLGTLALAAGSIDDAAAWCLLAIVLASFGNDASVALMAIGGGIAYGAVVLLVVRPLLARLLEPVNRQSNSMSGAVLGGILMLLMLGAWITDLVGIYAVFGAFIMGIAMPRGVVTRALHWFIEPLTTNLLLPLFFIYSGLNTQLSLVFTPVLLGLTAIVILAACLGKGVACWGAARLTGESQREALAIGSLMNARGLMELILLNIGLERGVITPTFFTIMVLMAIVTTLMATPMFEWVYGRHWRAGLSLSDPVPATPGP